jgi:hypothetical protein
VAAASRLRRWRQRDSVTSAAAWRRCGNSGSVSGGGGSGTPRCRRKLGGGTAAVAASAAVAAARSVAAVHSVTAAARRQWQRQRRWRQRDSATSAAAWRRRGGGGSVSGGGGSAKRGGGAQRDGGRAVAAVRMAVDYGGRRQFVGDVAVVWMMALGSGVCAIKINLWLIVSKRIFCPRELPVACIFPPRICPWLPPKPITNKKKPGRFARGQKNTIPLLCCVFYGIVP